MKRMITFAAATAAIVAPAYSEPKPKGPVQPSFASSDDLGQAARCSAIVVAKALQKRKFQLISVEGMKTFTKAVDFSASTSALAGGPIFIPIGASASTSITGAKTVTTSRGEVIGIDVNSQAPAECLNPLVRTRDKRGRPSQDKRGLLFTDQDVVPLSGKRSGYKVVTISETFKRTTTAEVGGKFTLWGLLKSETKIAASDVGENGYSITFCFQLPAVNDYNVAFSPAQMNAPCK